MGVSEDQVTVDATNSRQLAEQRHGRGRQRQRARPQATAAPNSDLALRDIEIGPPELQELTTPGARRETDDDQRL